MSKRRRKGITSIPNVLKKIEDKLRRKPGIMVGRPIASAPKHVNNYQVHLLFEHLMKEGYTVDREDLWNPMGCSIVAQARNMIVDTFLKRDGVKQPLHDYILFIDDDQCFPMDYNPFDAFKILLDAGKDIIGAMTVRKFPPHNLNISMFKDGAMRHIGWYPEDRPFKVHQLGFGMVLVKRCVIEKLYYSTDPPAPLFQNPLQYNPMIKKVELRGEDFLFCTEALKAGFDIWVEPRIPLQHIANYPFGVDNFVMYRDTADKKEYLNICQDTDLYAPLVESLRKSSPLSKKGRVGLSDVVNAGRTQKETCEASNLSTKDTTSESIPQKQILNEKNESKKEPGGLE